MTLILKLDLDMVKMYHHTKNEVSMSTGSKVIPRTHTHTDTHTQTHTHNTHTHTHTHTHTTKTLPLPHTREVKMSNNHLIENILVLDPVRLWILRTKENSKVTPNFD